MTTTYSCTLQGLLAKACLIIQVSCIMYISTNSKTDDAVTSLAVNVHCMHAGPCYDTADTLGPRARCVYAHTCVSLCVWASVLLCVHDRLVSRSGQRKRLPWRLSCGKALRPAWLRKSSRRSLTSAERPWKWASRRCCAVARIALYVISSSGYHVVLPIIAYNAHSVAIYAMSGDLHLMHVHALSSCLVVASS